MNDKTLKILAAMSLIATLEVVNMCTMKMDGGIFTLAVAAISGLGGYIIRGKEK